MLTHEEVIDEGVACDADVARVIVNMRKTRFNEVQDPKSPYYDVEFPKHFKMTPRSRRRNYLVHELREYVRKKAANRSAGGVK